MIIDESHIAEYSTERPTNVFTDEMLKDHFGGKVENYYASHARFIASQYNRREGVEFSQTEGRTAEKRRAQNTTVGQIYSNYAYVLGEQENFTYAYLTQDEEGGNLPAPFTKGEQIFRLVEFIKGSLRRLLSNAKVSVESLDPSKQSKKAERLQQLEIKDKLIDMFEDLEKQTGMGYYPEGMGGADIDQAKEDIELSPSDELEEAGLDLLTDTISRNRMSAVALRAAIDAVVGRHATFWPEVENGRLVVKSIPPYMMILDSSEDDDFRKRDEYRGFIEFLTISEVRSKYTLTKEEADLLPSLFAKSTLANHYNNPGSGTFGFNWLKDAGGEKTIACMTAWFRSEVPSKKEVSKGRLRKKHSDKYARGEDYADTVLERVTLIGNCILKDYGNDTNVVYSPHDSTFPEFPLCTYTPNMYLGTSRSIVDRFQKFQDDIDSYEWKIKDKVSKDLGKVVIVNGYKVGEGDSPQNIINNLKKIALHVTEGLDGEEPTALDGRSMIEQIDMTNSHDIQTYLALIQNKSQMMEEVINASKVSLGQVQRYIGMGSQQASIDANAAGMSSYIDGFMEFYTYTLQYMLNKIKIMLADTEGAERAELVLSEGGIKFFKNSRSFQLEDLMVRVTIEDVIDEQAKARLVTYTQAMVQNAADTGIDWEDILDLETSRTYTELRRRLKRKIRRAKDEKKKAMMQQMEQQMMAEQKASEERFAQQQMSEEGKDRRDAAKNDVIMSGKVLDKIPMGQPGGEQMAQ